MTRPVKELLGFHDLDSVGWDWSELLWGPLFAPAVLIKEAVDAGHAQGQAPSTPSSPLAQSDFMKSIYARGQAGLAAAQTAQQAAQAKLAAVQNAPRSRSAPATVIPINVPSFALPGTPIASVPAAPVAAAGVPIDPASATAAAPDSVQGDPSMSNAAAHVEAVTKNCDLHASIGPDGSASCPACGTPLHVNLSEGPCVDPGSPAGQAHVVGEMASTPVLKASSAGTCVCTCPKCGCPICLSLTAAGYGEETVSGYHVLGARRASSYLPGVRPVLGTYDSGYYPHPGARPVYGTYDSGYYPNPGARPVFGRAPAPAKESPHKASIVKAGNAVAKAMKAGSLATNRAKQYDPSKHKTVVPLTALHGFGEDPEAVYVHGIDNVRHVDESIWVHGRALGTLDSGYYPNPGARPVYGDDGSGDVLPIEGNVINVFGCIFGADRPLTPVQKAKVQKHAAAVVRHAAAVKAAAEAGAKAIAAAKDLDMWRKAKAPVIAKFLNASTPPMKGMKTGPKGHVQVIGQTITVFGLDANGVAPGQPGYDPSTEDGTGAGGGAGGGDGNFGFPAPAPLLTMDTDPNVVKPPVRGQQLTSDDLKVVWQNVPPDGVICTRPIPYGAVASWSIDQGDHYGAFYSPTGWMLRTRDSGGHTNDDPLQGDAADAGGGQWGPLVGRPNAPDGMNNLQWAVVPKQWFFQSAVAPPWATAEADAIIAATNQKTLDTDNAAITADNARIAQEIAQAAEDSAKQSAANALAISASDTQTQVSQAALASQQAQLDLQTQQQQQAQAAAQAQADLQAAQAQQQADLQAQQADLQAAQVQAQLDARARAAQLSYIEQHPEVLAPDQGGGGDDGGSDGSGDDATSPVEIPSDDSDFSANLGPG